MRLFAVAGPFVSLSCGFSWPALGEALKRSLVAPAMRKRCPANSRGDAAPLGIYGPQHRTRHGIRVRNTTTAATHPTLSPRARHCTCPATAAALCHTGAVLSPYAHGPTHTRRSRSARALLARLVATIVCQPAWFACRRPLRRLRVPATPTASLHSPLLSRRAPMQRAASKRATHGCLHQAMARRVPFDTRARPLLRPPTTHTSAACCL